MNDYWLNPSMDHCVFVYDPNIVEVPTEDENKN